MSDKVNSNGVKSGVRSRAPNFTKEDQVLIVAAIKPYTNIIECKQTDGVKQSQKQETWKKITTVFNSNTSGQPRTTENLLSFYRNLKSKLKKQHSDAKMMLVDSVQRNDLIKAIEENGKDWEKVASTASTSWNNPILCEEGFRELEKQSRREDQKFKKNLLGTGGGPLLPEESDSELKQIKKFIEPQYNLIYIITT